MSHGSRAPRRFAQQSLQTGFGLLETILAVALFAVIMSTGGLGVLQTFSLNTAASNQEEATSLAQEGAEAARSIARRDWAELQASTNGLDDTNGFWEFSGSSDTLGDYQREVIVEPVERDGTGQVVLSGGSVDPDSFRVISRVSWTAGGQPVQTEVITYLTNYAKPVADIADKLAWLCGTELTSGDNFNVSSAAAVEWTDTSVHPSYFSYDVGSPTELTIEQAGDYMFAVTNPLSRVSSNENSRTRVEVELRINGVVSSIGIGRSSYIRSANNQNESSNHIHVLETSLAQGDVVEVFAQGLAQLGDADDENNTSRTCLLARAVESETPAFSATATQSTDGSDLNENNEYDLEWSTVRVDTGYTHSGGDPDEIEIQSAGEYLVMVNIPQNGSSTRTSVEGFVRLDGNLVPGGTFTQGYIRDTNGDTDSSSHWSGVVSVSSTPATLTVGVEREAGNGTVTVGSNEASITVIQLPSTGVYVGRGSDLTTGSNWNNSSPGLVEWTTDQVIDNGVYTHSTNSSPQTVTVDQAGDYLLAYNDSLNAGGGRSNVKITVLVNGSPVDGAETKSHYIRGSSGHNQSSGSLVFLLQDLAANDQITVQAEREADSNTVTANEDAILMLWQQ